jgi:glutamate N-acetyltransferase/amino-acid N-acetyltransferase
MNLPLGFRYAAIHAGIRHVIKDDLGMIVSDTPAAAAGVFTTNLVCAAPVVLSKKHLRSTRGRARAILVNAGNANCATRTGEQVALASVRAAAVAIGVKPAEVLPASTGVIGVELDAALITNALPKLVSGLDPARFNDVANAILTTDTRAKTAFADAGGARIAGMTKGAGMIHPHMATTLCFVMTDAAISAPVLRTALKRATQRSFNRLSVDGDMSTNDTIAVLANGASGVKPRTKAFEEALTSVLESLARQIAADGEGARKTVTIEVTGAASDRTAERIARAIANSPLVKTAIAGSDPNWGRILSAAGASGAKFDPRRVDINLQDVPVCRSGLAADFSEEEMSKRLDAHECAIQFRIRGTGRGRATFWTCDFTEDYIRINGSYRT